MKTNPSLNRSLTTLLCAATASLFILSQPAQAGYIVTLQQVGSNVVANGSGAIDLTGLSFDFPTFESAGIRPNGAVIVTGSSGTGNFLRASLDRQVSEAGAQRLPAVAAATLSG